MFQALFSMLDRISRLEPIGKEEIERENMAVPSLGFYPLSRKVSYNFEKGDNSTDWIISFGPEVPWKNFQSMYHWKYFIASSNNVTIIRISLLFQRSTSWMWRSMVAPTRREDSTGAEKWKPTEPRPLLSFPPPSFFCQSSLLYAISTQSLVDLFSMMSAPSKTTKTSDQVLPSPTFSTMTFGDSLCQKSNLTNPIDLLPSFHLGKQKEMCGQSNLWTQAQLPHPRPGPHWLPPCQPASPPGCHSALLYCLPTLHKPAGRQNQLVAVFAVSTVS